MDGWVGHVGWPIADGLTTKWSPIQLAVWRRIGKVRRPRPSILSTMLCCQTSNYPDPMHKLKHKHKLNHRSLRLVVVPTSVLVWSAEDTFHLLNRFTLSATAVYIVITTRNARNCNIFFPENSPRPPWGGGIPLPRRGLWPLSIPSASRSEHLPTPTISEFLSTPDPDDSHEHWSTIRCSSYSHACTSSWSDDMAPQKKGTSVDKSTEISRVIFFVWNDLKNLLKVNG